MIRVPGSKSITNRALILAALTARGHACELRNALRSDDTEILIEALRTLGFRVLTDWQDGIVCVTSQVHEPRIPNPEADLFVGNSGTSMRFLTALVAVGQGRYRLHGVPRMHERPIADLLDGLRHLGVNAFSEAGNGCPPVVVQSQGLRGGSVHIKGNVSSQFLSALLLVAHWAEDDVTLHTDGPLVSEPYVAMTARMLRHWGVPVIPRDHGWSIPALNTRTPLRPDDPLAARIIDEGFDPRHHVWIQEYPIEPDASSASYFFAAAAITGGRVLVPGLKRDGLQGDVEFAWILEQMGCQTAETRDGVEVTGAPLRGIDIDMNAISDCVMTLAVTACFADSPTRIRNIAHVRHKESDRLAALVQELHKVGAHVAADDDSLLITPRPLHGAELATHDDHRLAMSFALLGLRVPGIVIENPACVAKTYPNFFEDLERLR